MPEFLTSIEIIINYLGAFAGLGTLIYSIYKAVIAQSQPSGQQTGAARRILRTSHLLIASLLFFILAYILWRPLPIHLTRVLQLVATFLGAVIFIASVGLYLWGLLTLGENFNFASGFGVRLQQAHRLITHGPYAIVRHPMYLGVIMACWGGLLLYRTWTMLVFALMMFGLVYRARKEDEALLLAFGPEWESYQQRVPSWLPRLTRD